MWTLRLEIGGLGQGDQHLLIRRINHSARKRLQCARVRLRTHCTVLVRGFGLLDVAYDDDVYSSLNTNIPEIPLQ